MSLGAAVAAFTLVAALMVLTPGLDVTLILRTAITHGRKAAIWAGLGITAGVLVWGVAAVLGISALLLASPVAYQVLRWCGAAYLVWLGGRMVWAAWRGGAGHGDAAEHGSVETAGFFRTGLATDVLNPKMGVFYLAVLPQFIPPGYPPHWIGLLLTGVHAVLSMSWFTILTVAVHSLSRILRRPAVQRGVDAVAGSLIIGFGVLLALSHAG